MVYSVNRKRALLVAAVLVLGIVAGIYGFCQSALPNLRIVRHGVLWRCGQPNALGLRVAQWAGVRTIVCLRDGTDDRVVAERELAQRLGMRFVQDQLQYSGEDAEATVSHFLQVVGDVRQQPVLVHCARGKERTGVCGAVFRIALDGWTNERALQEMYALGFKQGSLPELERFVASYPPQRRLDRPTVAADREHRATPPGKPQEPGGATP